jgi:KUP system potassium uptake protein
VNTSNPQTPSALAALTLGALGVVYGDIGTSPLYALKEVFHGGHVPVTHDNILGVLSLIFWTMTVIVSLKYVMLILRADNNGEGGLIAMLALATNAVKNRPNWHRNLMIVGLIGTAVFYGDGVITPAISVLSAVEGLSLVAPQLSGAVVPITLVLITLLFAVQRLGTTGIGRAFGPITLIWFAVLFALGLPHVIQTPEILHALNPMYAIQFGLTHQVTAFIALGAIVLCVTGAEALYADLGHFGKTPIRLAWYMVVMPALVVNYFGQGALLLKQPEAITSPFYLLAPKWASLPLLILATLATIIASQALITAAFSVTRQAIQMGLFPRMSILHTSVRETGQIYVPVVNWGLYVLIVLAVALFGSSTNLAAAYGIAVTMDMTITTIMTFFVIRFRWNYPLALSILATGIFFAIDIAFFSANLLKFFAGGWFPLAIGGVIFMLMLTWEQGVRMVRHRLRDEAINLQEFLDSVFMNPPLRVSGTAVFLTPSLHQTPTALMHNLKHNKVLHEHNVFLTVCHHDVPWVGFDKRVRLESLGHNCWAVTLNFGFKNDPDVPEALKLLEARGVPLSEMETSYFMSRDIVVATHAEGMALWRQKLFASMHRNAAAAAEFLRLPTNRVVELASKVEI